MAMTEFLSINARVDVRDVELRVAVREGETVAVVGPNGAGKSTLLHLIAGSLRPDSGSITLRGSELSGPTRHLPPHRRRFSFVEQHSLLFPHLSVLDNVAFGPRSRGVPKAEARARARVELEATACAELAERNPRQLSGGQAQRISLARALAIDPEILLLDEPFAALDVSVTPDLRRLLRERLADQTALLVTHDFLDVVTLADRVIVVEDGRVVADGPVAEVCAAPPTRFLADFVGVNLLTGTAAAGNELRVGDQILVGAEPTLQQGHPARATVAPNAVSVFLTAPEGSPRNVLSGTVELIESRGSIVGVTVDVSGQRLRADLTAGAVAELSLVPGTPVYAVVKATQVQLHPDTHDGV
ncbi:sulfate/molybdate ABC transporter ATP-binding protein [Tessaracoccus caeni]|uniref:sulfate/molybdate ABC transporter ATP-binding protein n=1 Tax=Tessaracoccus caeni TaxID=3031239 RepID=UPI0023D9F71D|nr:ATP-binding cassette domain-containing protein [Tessaracoccus caeni]MDF1487622.1 ATP-binding cassette domain-containing protein [Tessaracoccus caeni]